VYFYRFDIEHQTAFLEGWAGIQPAPIAGEVRGPAIIGSLQRDTPIVIHESAWADERFAAFSEIVDRRLEGVVSVPLLHDGATLGRLNIGRAKPASMPASDLAALLGLSLPMGALLAARNEFARLSQELADRKILDRAKGILQHRMAWTEEEAYTQLRRASRQRRTKIREIAREIIESGVPRHWEARRA
jgi:hypothetical protein